MLLKSSIFVALSLLSAVTPAVSVAVERSSGSDMQTTHWVIDGCKPLPPPWCRYTDPVHRCACNLEGKYNCKTPAFTSICKRRGCHCKYVPHHPPSLEEYEGEDDFDEVEEVEDESLLGGLLEVIAKVHLL